ncbi:MAG: hypothetical protein IJY16_09515 [Clostridia bacterium]|nr:hypothetical protein [Clostridia bacterium]
MYTDLFGKNRVKVGLHHHTTVSDGRKTPEEVIAIYRAAGYDAIALTDHWKFGAEQHFEDFTVYSGDEINVGGSDGSGGVYHILCLFAGEEPVVDKKAPAQDVIDAIHRAGGLAVLAHPAWSLNTPEMIRALRGLDGTEIFNTVSQRGMSRRGDSSLIVDMLASAGYVLPLFAADDSHFYGEGNYADSPNAFIMVESDSADAAAVRAAIEAGRFYASEGPEVHLAVRDGKGIVDCSPASEVVLFSNGVYSERVTVGEDITHVEYTPLKWEKYLRARVTDKDGKQAWSQILPLS